MNTYVILHNIRSAHNVGSVFRTCDGAGVSKIFLTGYTPAPTDRFGRVQKEIQKTSLGATESVAWEISDDATGVIADLQSKGVVVVAVEQTEIASSYKLFQPTGDVAFVFGNEIDGIDEHIIREADVTIVIPQCGVKESLNVSVCAGIILFHFSPQLSQSK